MSQKAKQDRLNKRALALLTKAGGSLDCASFVHKLGIDSETFKKLVTTLEICNLLEIEICERSKVAYHLTAA